MNNSNEKAIFDPVVHIIVYWCEQTARNFLCQVRYIRDYQYEIDADYNSCLKGFSGLLCLLFDEHPCTRETVPPSRTCTVKHAACLQSLIARREDNEKTSEKLQAFLRTYVLDRMKPASDAPDVVRTVDRFRSVSGFSPHEHIRRGGGGGGAAGSGSGDDPCSTTTSLEESELIERECELLQSSCYSLQAMSLVADDAVRNTNTEISRALGPVIWELIRLAMLSRPGIKAFDLLKHASTAFSNCVCGGNANRFLARYRDLLLERRRRGKDSREDDPDANKNDGMNLVYTLHEKIKFDPISNPVYLRNYTFNAPLKDLRDPSRMFEHAARGNTDVACIHRMRLLVPLPTYGHIMTLVRRHIVEPATRSEKKFRFPVNLTCREFLENNNALDENDATADCPLVPPSVRLSADQLYFETEADHTTFDFALAPETCDMMCMKNVDFTEARVERFVESCGEARDWAVVLLLWWSLLSLRLNEHKARHFAKQITRGMLPPVRRRWPTLNNIESEGVAYAPHRLTLMSVNTHNDILTLMLNCSSFMASTATATAYREYIESDAYRIPTFEQLFILMRIWLHNSYEKDVVTLLETEWLESF